MSVDGRLVKFAPNINGMNKHTELKVYSKRGRTVYNVSKNRTVLNILRESMMQILEADKTKTLPFVVYMETVELTQLNKQLFNKTIPKIVQLYAFDGVRMLLSIQDKKSAPLHLQEPSTETKPTT